MRLLDAVIAVAMLVGIGLCLDYLISLCWLVYILTTGHT